MKKLICVLLLVCICFSFVACGNAELETIIEYVEVPVEVEKIVEVPVEVVIEKEVPIEVIVEKEVLIEVPVEVIKEVIKQTTIYQPIELKDCKIFTWEEVVGLQKGDRIENVFIKGNSFVSKFTNELYPANKQTYWTSNAKYPECYSMAPVRLKMNYTKWGTVYTDSLLNDYYTWGNIGIISGTIEEIIWHEDSYGNRTVDIIFDDNNFELKTFIDFCPVTNVK